jgi:hypothetical protein
MLGALEQRLEGLVGEVLADRAGVTVVSAGSGAPPAPGAAVVEVGVAVLRAAVGFEPSTRPVPPGSDETRRIRPVRLGFEARVRVTRRPADEADDAVATSRRLLLDDLALIGHALDAPEIRDGSAFVDEAVDEGYRVLEFGLGEGSVGTASTDDALRGEWSYRGRAEVWPPTPPEETGLIAGVSAILAAQPLSVVADDQAVPAGGSTRLRVRGVAPRRLADGAATPVGQAIAVRVRSRHPAARRGRITTGADGSEAGVRIVPVGELETTVEYAAPETLPPGAPVEHVEIFLARGDGRRGLLLGSIAIPLLAPDA